MLDRETLAVYLNDHLAGSVAALQMMDRLCEVHEDEANRSVIATLREAVASDQRILQNLLVSIGATESVIAKALAWVGEHASRVKLSVERQDDAGVMFFEAIEALALGFHGRQALWHMLDAIEGSLQSGYDFRALSEAVSEQILVLEQMRLEAGRNAFTVSSAH